MDINLTCTGLISAQSDVQYGKVVSKNEKEVKKPRESNIELLRIVAMLAIVAHHYVVNSGLLDLVHKTPGLSLNSVFLLLLGPFGNTATNCFILIMGYFMCMSKMTLKKFLKLFLEIEFYKIVINLIFLFSAYRTYSYKGLFASLTPFYGIGKGFVPSILPFFLFIPFLNSLIHAMDKKMHLRLVALCLFLFTFLPSFIFYPIFITADVNFGDLGWFSTVYLLAAYMRIYPEEWFGKKNIWLAYAVISIVLAFASVIVMSYVAKCFEVKSAWYAYYFVAGPNKILAVTTSVCVFMLFKNMKPFYNKYINTIAASVFGVLLIHANGPTMRRWLWKDTLNNTGYYNADFHILLLHAICSVIAIYIICTLLDMLRIKFIEKPFFRWYDRRVAGN